ncbi:hypothetical protein CEXT_240971 [Caerostris extrusa]|uniref:Uncharacterized protein n=1 Tax=Caerostris extrusa TaxID=172846 RepID=A0AAV4PSG1_CAEEX|nr:hypothetical protein CEXT_240971 [Caerostris extrusa]
MVHISYPDIAAVVGEELRGGDPLMMKRVMYGFNLMVISPHLPQRTSPLPQSNRLTPPEPAGVNMYAIYIHFESRDKPLNSRPAASTLRLVTLITLLGREIRESNRLAPQKPVGLIMCTIYIHFESRDKPLNSRPAASTLQLIITSFAAVNTVWRRITWWYFSNDEKSYIWIQFNGEFSSYNSPLPQSNLLTSQEPAGVSMYTICIHFEFRDKPLNSRPAASTLCLITLITLLGREVRGFKCNFPSTEETFKSMALSFNGLEPVKRVENADP